MSFNLTRIWYRSSLHWVSVVLLPFSWLFGLITGCRRFLYRHRILPTKRVAVPVLVVGNITVGGTGKTPFVIWLAKFLRELGYRPGIVCRGVGGRKHLLPHLVSLTDDAALVGDEALVLAKNTECKVVVCCRRPEAVAHLLAQAECDVVISDDGLQHYRLARDIEIAMVDGVRYFGNKQLLPAGPLRESVKRLHDVDMVVVNGGDKQAAFRMDCVPEQLVSLIDNSQKKSLADFSQQTVHAVAGIGHPERFFHMLEQAGMRVIRHVFPDHYHFNSSDLQFNDALPVMMTEKDAIKCGNFADARCWFLTISTKVDTDLRQAIQHAVQHAMGSK